MRSSWAASGASCDCNPYSQAVAHHKYAPAEDNTPNNQTDMPAFRADHPGFSCCTAEYARIVPMRRCRSICSGCAAQETCNRSVAGKFQVRKQWRSARRQRLSSGVARRPSHLQAAPAASSPAGNCGSRRRRNAATSLSAGSDARAAERRTDEAYCPTVVRQGNSRSRSLNTRALGCSDPMTTARDALSRGVSASFQPACSSSTSALLNSKP